MRRKVNDTCVLPLAKYVLETMALTIPTNKRHVLQRAMEHAMFGLSLRGKIKNKEIRRRTMIANVIHRVADLKVEIPIQRQIK